ncbi:glutamyl-tRNA amidotransferase [Candidatus Gottesmanbacteria bacterium RIFCSPHIGHO2_01_FULL_39_10]|uniref:Glutamyl-tRNA amidotransferase n=1 Tax=Candidatus Gottesmanbacteria bacterium RIFCSPHIGHO2_01_FULL_39_10 TaxID=1798375 RepID=A0A1F5ZNJ6_9BACT|nr:MAG: glutamyl-tRNA amidotransferase [Candidatus Gottesmanbacteria bacterium RIFCSPHIGHO2_01_FULL_39_10]
MIKQKIQDQIVVALKAGDKVRLDVLRFILSSIKYAEIEKQKELTDDEIVSLLSKEVKKRKEAIEMFKKGGRTEGIEKEEKQIVVINEFLPEKISQEELEKIISEVISSSGADPQMGKVIGTVMGKIKGQADGSEVARIVKEKLAGK